MRPVHLIEIDWSGPFKTLPEIASKYSETRNFLLARIGNHYNLGRNTLLQLNKFEDSNIEKAMDIVDLPPRIASSTEFYIGTIVSKSRGLFIDEIKFQLEVAHGLLSYHCSPPFSSQKSVPFGTWNNHLIINYGNCYFLPKTLTCMETSREQLKNIPPTSSIIEVDEDDLY
jgi:hypothetical protein